MPRVALAAGLSLNANNWLPKFDRRSTTTSAAKAMKINDPITNWSSLLDATNPPTRNGAKVSDPVPNGANW